MQDWISVSMASQQLGISHQAVYAAIKEGRVRSTRMGTFRLVSQADVKRWKLKLGR